MIFWYLSHYMIKLPLKVHADVSSGDKAGIYVQILV